MAADEEDCAVEFVAQCVGPKKSPWLYAQILASGDRGLGCRADFLGLEEGG